MVYKNKGGQPRERTMVAAYSLVTKFGAKQKDVAAVLGCSQATIASWVKEVGYQQRITGMQRELADANEYISELQHILPQPDGDYINGDYYEEDNS